MPILDRVRGVRARRAAPESGRLDYPHADIYLRTRTRAETLRLRSCQKEPWTVDWIAGWIRDGETFYDIGANVGPYTLVAASRSKGVRVVAIEPGYANYAALCENLALNGVDKQVVALPVALSESTKLVEFAYRKVDPGGGVNAIEGGSREESSFEPRFRQSLLSYRLDDLVELFGLPRPNHIKIDVEGGEAAVLAGAEHILGSGSVRSLMIEVAPSTEADIVHICDRHGLTLSERFQGGSGERALPHWYGLFTAPASP
jgi:FkbM family methyltransferase